MAENVYFKPLIAALSVQRSVSRALAGMAVYAAIGFVASVFVIGVAVVVAGAALPFARTSLSDVVFDSSAQSNVKPQITEACRSRNLDVSDPSNATISALCAELSQNDIVLARAARVRRGGTYVLAAMGGLIAALVAGSLTKAFARLKGTGRNEEGPEAESNGGDSFV